MQFTLQTIDQITPIVQGFRKRAGLTQTDMAKKLGVSQQSYAKMEANLSSASVERLYTILRLLGVRIKFELPEQGMTVISSEDKLQVIPEVSSTTRTTQKQKAVAKRAPEDMPDANPLATPKDTKATKRTPKLSSPVKMLKRTDKTKW